jgi:hypothetical protein
LSGTPFARLPNSWINHHGTQYGWTAVINLLRDKDKAARALISQLAVPEHTSIASTGREYFRETVRDASNKSSSSSFDLRRQIFPSCQPLKDPAPNTGDGMSDLRQSEVVQNNSPGEVLTERVPQLDVFRDVPSPVPSPLVPSPLVPPPVHSLVPSPVTLPIPSPILSPIPSPSLVPSPVPSPDPSPVSSRVSLLDPEPDAEPDPSPVSSQVSFRRIFAFRFMFPAEAIEWDLLDCDAIPTLIGSVLRGTNVNEFLERLEVLAYSGRHSFRHCCRIFSLQNIPDIGKTTIQRSNGNQFSSMIRQVCDNKKYAEHTGQAIRTAYEVFWHSGEILSFR